MTDSPLPSVILAPMLREIDPKPLRPHIAHQPRTTPRTGHRKRHRATTNRR